MRASTELHYRRAKWQVTEFFVYPLRYTYGLKEDWTHPNGWYGVTRQHGQWFLWAAVGCAWDGATKYPDYSWMMAPSLVHDILHWLIKRGVISTIYNDVIDLELKVAILNGKEPIPWWQGGNSKLTRKVRAYIILRGTNIANEKLDPDTPDVEQRSVLV